MSGKYHILAYPGDGPGDPIVNITPHDPFVTDDLFCSAKNSTMTNGNIGYNFRWYKNGVYQEQLQGLNWVDSSFLKKDDMWSCAAILYDGSKYGSWSSDVVVVQDSIPSIPKVRLFPGNPAIGGLLTCYVDIPSIDNDGDLVYYNYMWYRNNADLPFRIVTTIQLKDSIVCRAFLPGDIIECKVVASNTSEDSESSIFSVSQEIKMGSCVYGDVNGDGVVNETDIQELQSVISGS